MNEIIVALILKLCKLYTPICIQTLYFLSMGPISSMLSNAHVPVVPIVVMQTNGIKPLAMSSSIAF